MSEHKINGATAKPTESSFEVKAQMAMRRAWPFESKIHSFSPAAIASLMGFNVTDMSGVSVPEEDHDWGDIAADLTLRLLFLNHHASLSLVIRMNEGNAWSSPGMCRVRVVHCINPFPLEGKDSEYDREYETTHIYRNIFMLDGEDLALLSAESSCLRTYARRYMQRTRDDNPFARWEYESFR
jgi:hypothetical protein